MNNKFNIEYKKILAKQNLIQEDLIEEYSIEDLKKDASNLWNKTGGKAVNYISKTAKSVWNSITQIGSSISDAISKGVTWGVNKIKQVLQKLWDLLTPDNAQQTVNTVKQMTKIMPEQARNKTNQAIQLAESKQYKEYLKKELKTKCNSIEQFNKLSQNQKKKIHRQISEKYIRQKNIISEEIVSEVAISSIIYAIIWLITAIIGYFAIDKIGERFFPDQDDKRKKTAETDTEILKQQRQQQKIQHKMERHKEAFEQWKNDQQRQKIFAQIINVSAFR